MGRTDKILAFSLTVLLALLPPGFARAEEGEQLPDFPALTLKDGTVLKNCFVTRVETDGLVIRHDQGLAHVSFFDLDHEIQEKYAFDPVAAMALYKKRLETQREQRKQRLLEAEKAKAEKQLELAEERRYEIAQSEWIPCEAYVFRSNTKGCYVHAKQIVFVPTETRSTLGFVVPGPPKRKLKSFSHGMIFLKNITPIPKAGAKWLGYIDPVSIEEAPHPETGDKTIPIHSAISRQP